MQRGKEGMFEGCPAKQRGITLAAAEEGCRSRRLSQEGLISTRPCGKAISGVLDRAHHPALLLPEQLHSLACKGQGSCSSWPAVGADLEMIMPRRRCTNPRATQTLAEQQKAAIIFDVVALCAEDTLAGGTRLAPAWLPRCSLSSEGR